MKNYQIYEIIREIPEGSEFLNKYPENDLIFQIIKLDEIERIQNEYPGFFPSLKDDLHEDIHVMSITIISKNLGINGYPKCKIYLKIINSADLP